MIALLSNPAFDGFGRFLAVKTGPKSPSCDLEFLTTSISKFYLFTYLSKEMKQIWTKYFFGSVEKMLKNNFRKNIFYFLKANRLNFDMHVVRNSRSHSDNFGPVLTAKNLPKPTKVGFGSRALHIALTCPTHTPNMSF